MATNSYFRNFDAKNEQELLHSLVTESIQVYGHDVSYIPRTLINEDTILGEDSISEFKDAHSVEMYVKSVDGFEGEGDFASKFGIQIKDTIEFIVSKKVFEKNLSHETTINRPNEGDLIYLPLSKSLFEIKFVEHENPFYQMGKLYTFKLSCELFEYSQEDFDTGFSDIDRVEGVSEDVAFNIYLTGGAVTNYSVGEVVYQGTAFGTQGSSADWFATVLEWVTGGTAGPSGEGYNLLTVAGPSGASGFILGVGNTAGVTGSTSGAFYTAGTTASPSIRTLTIAQDFDDADDFELEADSIFDFTDKDPFSEGNL